VAVLLRCTHIVRKLRWCGQQTPRVLDCVLRTRNVCRCRVNPAHGWLRSDPQNAFLISTAGAPHSHEHETNSSSAPGLGFFVAAGRALWQSGLYWLASARQVRQRISELAPSRESDLIGAFIRHAGLIGASAALDHFRRNGHQRLLANQICHRAAIADTSNGNAVAESAGTQGTRSWQQDLP